MKITEIIEAWKADSKVDDLNIDLECSRIPNLHSKYVEWLSTERSTLRGLQIQRRNLIRKLREYYLGTSTQEELEELKRDPYPQRILKNEVMTFVDADNSIIAIDSKIAVQEEKVEVLIEIVKSINGRNFNFKNIIDWRRITLGG